MRSEFDARRNATGEASGGLQMHIGATEVHLFHNASEHYVSLYLDHGTDMALVPRIAARFNAVLATGRHDRLFEN